MTRCSIFFFTYLQIRPAYEPASRAVWRQRKTRRKEEISQHSMWRGSPSRLVLIMILNRGRRTAIPLGSLRTCAMSSGLGWRRLHSHNECINGEKGSAAVVLAEGKRFVSFEPISLLMTLPLRRSGFLTRCGALALALGKCHPALGAFDKLTALIGRSLQPSSSEDFGRSPPSSALG